jgi:hypothetical protein
MKSNTHSHLKTGAALMALLTVSFLNAPASSAESVRSVEVKRPSLNIANDSVYLNDLKEKAPYAQAAPVQPMVPSAVRVASNYTFATATNGSLTDMSSGTTQLVAANQDDTASTVASIGFEFFFQGAVFTQF